MYRFLTRGLKVRADERRPFFWTLTFFILVFLVMGIFRSYVDTEFLQHYGASQVPVMLLINGVLTIAVFWIVGLRKTAPDSSLVAWFLILSAVATGALFFWVLSGSSGPYPLLYQLLNLQDSFFLVYLWNVAGALFDVRQGKRLFPLLMAGQVFGTAVGSFLVVPLAGIAGSDYLLTVVAAGYACVGVGLLGAGSILSPRTKRRREDQESTDKRPAEILALIRKYPIIRYLVASAFFPGFLLPIFTYQFFVIAHTTFPAEQSLLAFLSVFRGVVTLATFLLLFAVGGFYAKVGLARAAFVQPVNFFVVFAVALRMMRPTSVDPVNAILSKPGCSTISRPVSPSPVTIFTTPAGTPALWQISANSKAVSDVCSAGFSTTVLPIANAGAIFHASMSNGKFHGIICPQTPRGSAPGSSDVIASAHPAW